MLWGKCGVIDCENRGNVNGASTRVGGIVGFTCGTELNNCGNFGNVSGNYAVGGIIGRAMGCESGSITEVRNCSNEGSISVKNGNDVSRVYYNALTKTEIKPTAWGKGACVGGIVGNGDAVLVDSCDNHGVIDTAGWSRWWNYGRW